MNETAFPVTPALMSVADFAKWHGISESVVRQCIASKAKNYPPLRAKRTKAGRGGQFYITAEAAAEWRTALPDA